MTMQAPYPVELRTQMAKAFNLDEIRTLCFDLNIDFDDIKGEDKSRKITELILYSSRRGELSNLIAACCSQRPQLTWPELITSDESDSSLIAVKFIRELGSKLVAEKNYQHITGKTLEAFIWFGVIESSFTIDFTAFIRGDDLTTEDLILLCDQFFSLTTSLPIKFGLKPRGRNPNGLLCFIFEKRPTPAQLYFIKKQSRISHMIGKGGVTVSWCIDMETRKVYTHDKCVSILPPVIVPMGLLPIGLNFINEFLQKFK